MLKHLLLICSIYSVWTCFSVSAATNSLKVMTFNLRYASASDGDNNWENSGQNPDRRSVVCQILNTRLPDLVGFQEGEAVQLDYMAAQLPGWYAWQRGLPSGGSSLEHAAFAFNTNSLALLDSGLISLGTSPGGGYWNNVPGTNFNPYLYFNDMGLGFPRLVLWGKFQFLPTGQTFLFYTTHFDFNNNPQINSAWLIRDDAAARWDRMPSSPLAIVVGDFNSSQNNDDWKFLTGSYEYRGVRGDFQDSWYQTHASWTDSGTIHGFSGGTISENNRIDWILHRGGFQAVSTEIVTDSQWTGSRTQYPSDHYPVIAELCFPERAADFDADGLPDWQELTSAISSPTNADSDKDRLLDGEEDLNGNGVVDGGESDPSNPGDTQKPTDIRTYQMDGRKDYNATLLGSHGLDLYWRFDGRYLYVATQDAGEGNDHFIFVCSSPDQAVAAPWKKSGLVSQWKVYLADENDSDFCGWFDESRTMITNLFTARSAVYYQNGGVLEGVIDLASIFGAGFTNSLFVAAAPYGTDDGGALYPDAQVPAGNGDGNILGAAEYIEIVPGDLDGDGINDYADPDMDGDGLPNEWEVLHGMNPRVPDGHQDADGDGADEVGEYLAGTNPRDPTSVFKSVAEYNQNSVILKWQGLNRKSYDILASTNLLQNSWQVMQTVDAIAAFPTTNCSVSMPLEHEQLFYRIQMSN